MSSSEGRMALRVSVIYLVFSSLWIFFSDRVLAAVIADRYQLTLWQSYKGWFFVGVTACLLYILLLHELRQLRQARAAFEEQKSLNELIIRFSSMISHEFRNPLAVILTSNDILRKYYHRMTEAQRSTHFQHIQKQTDRLMHLLDDFLSVSKAQLVTPEIHPTLLDLEAFCQQMVEEAQHTADTHQIRFSVVGACHEVIGDEKLLHQAIGNLLSNAVKYSPDGSVVEFSLQCHPTKTIIRISDEGVGIPVEDQAQLFDAFYRAQNVGDIAGTGLGLAIARQAIEAQGGTIRCESELGKGSTFIIELPAQMQLN